MPSSSLRGRAMSAGAWSLAALIASQAMRLGGNLIMARLLVPEMFGIMMIATTLSVVLALFSDIGLRQNIIQSKRGQDPLFLDTAWTLQIVRGFVLFALTLLIAALAWLAQQRQWLPAGSTYAADELPAVLAVTGLSAVISGFQSTKVALAFRNFQQSKVALGELVAQSGGLLVMLLLGWWTGSIWSLVVAGLVSVLITTLLSHLWFVGPVNRPCWDRQALSELVSFGRWILLSSVVGVLAAQGDRIWLAGSLSAAELGIYAIAILLLGAMETAVQKFAAAVALPAFSEAVRADNPLRLRHLYQRLRLLADFVLLFSCGFLCVAAPVLIGWLYDERYAQAGQMLSVLAWSLFMLRYVVAQQLWLALGQSKYLALDNLLRFAALWSLLPLLLALGGPEWAIWGVALHKLPTLLLVIWANRRLGFFSPGRELVVLPALLLGFAAGGLMDYLLG